MAMMTGLRCPLHILTIPASGSSSPTARMTDGTLAALEFVVECLCRIRDALTRWAAAHSAPVEKLHEPLPPNSRRGKGPGCLYGYCVAKLFSQELPATPSQSSIEVPSSWHGGFPRASV